MTHNSYKSIDLQKRSLHHYLNSADVWIKLHSVVYRWSSSLYEPDLSSQKRSVPFRWNGSTKQNWLLWTVNKVSSNLQLNTEKTLHVISLHLISWNTQLKMMTNRALFATCPLCLWFSTCTISIFSRITCSFFHQYSDERNNRNKHFWPGKEHHLEKNYHFSRLFRTYLSILHQIAVINHNVQDKKYFQGGLAFSTRI